MTRRSRQRMVQGRWLGLLLALCAGLVQAAGPDMAQREIAGLIQALATSGCQFERNGDWHDADTARAHLQRKYGWLHKRGLADSAELFIERAATRSSRSGKPYRVRCAGKPVVESARWFEAELARLRARNSSQPPR